MAVVDGEYTKGADTLHDMSTNRFSVNTLVMSQAAYMYLTAGDYEKAMELFKWVCGGGGGGGGGGGSFCGGGCSCGCCGCDSACCGCSVGCGGCGGGGGCCGCGGGCCGGGGGHGGGGGSGGGCGGGGCCGGCGGGGDETTWVVDETDRIVDDGANRDTQ